MSLLRDSLAEAQSTVRAYDTKAQIVGVGYIFALGVVGSFEALLPEASELNPLIPLYGTLANTLVDR